MIPIYKPSIKKYTTSALQAINENWISNYGFNVQKAEKLLTKILGVKYCILMNNGTSATHCLLIGLKYKYPNIKKIYVPNNVFVAVWNCVLMEYHKSQIEVMKINEKTLKICQNSQTLPEKFICEAALSLCFKLREQLDEANLMLKSQEIKNNLHKNAEKYASIKYSKNEVKYMFFF